MDENDASFDCGQAVVIALGGNLPGAYDSVQSQLEGALARFDQIGLTVIARSPWWRSAAWPDPTRPAYVNGVALAATTLSPQQTLDALHGLERAFGRERAQANSDRTLDLDLIAFGRQVLAGPLTLPHPRSHERLFVMGPLAQIAPNWRHPVLQRTAQDLALSATVGRDARPL